MYLNISNNKLKEKRLELFMSKSNCFPERERERHGDEEKNLFELNLKRKSTNHLLDFQKRERERKRGRGKVWQVRVNERTRSSFNC